MSDKTKRSIICDNCGEELIVDSQYPHKFVLQLKSIDTGINTSGCTYAVAMYPPLNQTQHFCNFKCLKNWIEERER